MPCQLAVPLDLSTLDPRFVHLLAGATRRKYFRREKAKLRKAISHVTIMKTLHTLQHQNDLAARKKKKGQPKTPKGVKGKSREVVPEETLPPADSSWNDDCGDSGYSGGFDDDMEGPSTGFMDPNGHWDSITPHLLEILGRRMNSRGESSSSAGSTWRCTSHGCTRSEREISLVSFEGAFIPGSGLPVLSLST